MSQQQAWNAERLPFADNTFDLAVDIVTTMTLAPAELPIFEHELRRIVKPGGLFLSNVLSADDGFLAATNPGETWTTVEASGITDNYLSEDRLRQVYSQWEMVILDKTEKRDHFYGQEYTRRIWWALMRNTKL